jgi:UDP-glucose/iron transport system ATP-binding protein
MAQSESHGSGETLLSVTDIAVAAGGVRLLECVSFKLRRGELMGVTGPSGCGKTTLLRAVAGLTDPVAGMCLLRGVAPEVVGWPRYRRQVVLVQQTPVLLEDTVEANLVRPFQYRCATGGFPRDTARDLLKRLGVGEERLGQDARSLSVGQQQRVCLIRSLLTDPAVLLLDEPESGLDEESILAMETLVREEASRGGLAALVVSHQREQMGRWCDRHLDIAPFAAGEKNP